MAHVDHDQIEEVSRELAVDPLVFFRSGDRLVEAEINLVGRIDAAAATGVALNGLGARGELGHRSAEGAEVVHHGLVDQHIAVGEEQDALPASRLPQPPDDLEGDVGLARTGGHDQQDTVPPLGDGLDRGADGVDLVVARHLAASVLVILLKDHLLSFQCQALPGAIAGP